MGVKYQPTKDEQIVNAALLIFLEAITVHYPLFSSLSIHRKAFTADSEVTKPQVRTNGYLCGDLIKTRAIVVVKPAVLTNKLVMLATRMQESAQMVAWIKGDTAPARRRHMVYVLISLFIYSRLHIALVRNPI